MAPQSAELSAADGTRIFHRSWVPEGDSKGLLIVAHGLGEHGGRYGHVAAALNAAGITVCAADHRGHGQSGGIRGHVDGFSEYTRDLHLVIETSRKQHSAELPWVLYGHSMGGLIALLYAGERQDTDMSGLIISNPPLKLAQKAPAIKVHAGRLLAKFLPKLRLDNELVPENICRDPAVVKAYVEDPLVHRSISARWFTSFEQAQERVNEAGIVAIKPSQLWIVSGSDRICAPDGSREFVAGANRKDVQKREWPDFFHDAHSEFGQEEVHQAIVDFANSKSA